MAKRLFRVFESQGAGLVYEIGGYDPHTGAAEIVGGLHRFTDRAAAVAAVKAVGGRLED